MKKPGRFFYDEYSIQFYDESHFQLDEDRFLMLGYSNQTRLLLVCHCERAGGRSIRIISARKATRKEIQYYLGE